MCHPVSYKLLVDLSQRCNSWHRFGIDTVIATISSSSQLMFRTRNDQDLEDAEFELMSLKQMYEMEK